MHPSRVFEQAGPLSKAVIADIEAIFTQKKAQKREKLFISTTPANKVICVDSGLARGFVEYEGQCYTSWFVAEREFICTALPMGTGGVFYTDVEFLEPTVYWVCDYTRLQLLYDRHPMLNFAARTLAEQLLARCNEVQYLLRVLDPKERLEYFTALYPSVYQRAPLVHIASFLAMTPETLSRLRQPNCTKN